ncbi:hypothetical protein TWF281_006589 [Arthrobotrys megalospora]
MRKQSASKLSRGAPPSSSAAPTIRFSSARPNSIPTSVLHRSDIHYNTLQSHLAIQDHEMYTVRTVIDNIIELNPDFAQLNLRLTSERELLCRIANQHTGLFNLGITRKLAERNRETGAVGWLLYQLVLWCLKDNQRTSSRSGAARERSDSASSTASTSDLGTEAFYEPEHNDGGDEIDDSKEVDSDVSSDEQSVDGGVSSGNESSDAKDEVEGEGKSRGPQGEGFEIEAPSPEQMIDFSDLDRELEQFQENVKDMILRFGSPDLQRELHQLQENRHGGIMIPDDGPYTDDEDPPIEPRPFHRPHRNGIFFATCFLFVFAAVVVLCCIQYLHEKRGTSRLWDTLVLNQRHTIATATEHITSNGRSTSLSLTRATATVVAKVDL